MGSKERHEDERAVIRSASNAGIKRVRAAVAGKLPQLLLLEGDRLVDEALAEGLEFELLLVSEERTERLAELAGAGATPVEAGLLARIGTLKSGPGIVGLARAPREVPVGELAELLGDGLPLVLVVCGIADPVNLGALARSAEAAGASALVWVSGGVSPHNPRALRGSMGSLLRLPVFAAGSAAEAAAALLAAGLVQVRADTRGGADPKRFDWRRPVALWIGPESGDGSALDGAGSFEGVTIPMAGGVESLNVTVAASLLLFAADRVSGSGEARP
ncbi:MAG: RNA methyltransferase [Planctomycetota bacterium]|nr:RNA methyltransferase [Planctomycetota bacterium]